MGLDMFFVKKINGKVKVPKNGFWFNGFWRKTIWGDKNNVSASLETLEEVLASLEGVDVAPIDCIELGFDSSKNVDGKGDFEVALRLRKANAIHGWFVKNVQRGNDNCKVYLVKSRVLEKLKMDCLSVIADPIRASEVLPIHKGSFFGSYEYDDDYFESLLAVVNCLDSLNLDEEEIYYDAWH